MGAGSTSWSCSASCEAGRPLAEGKTKKEATPGSQASHQRRRLPPAADGRGPHEVAGPGGQGGRLFNPAWPARHPDGRRFGSATPEPSSTLGQQWPSGHGTTARVLALPERGLDNNEEFVMGPAPNITAGLRNLACWPFPCEDPDADNCLELCRLSQQSGNHMACQSGSHILIR